MACAPFTRAGITTLTVTHGYTLGGRQIQLETSDQHPRGPGDNPAIDACNALRPPRPPSKDYPCSICPSSRVATGPVPWTRRWAQSSAKWLSRRPPIRRAPRTKSLTATPTRALPPSFRRPNRALRQPDLPWPLAARRKRQRRHHYHRHHRPARRRPLRSVRNPFSSWTRVSSTSSRTSARPRRPTPTSDSTTPTFQVSEDRPGSTRHAIRPTRRPISLSICGPPSHRCSSI